MTTLLSSQYTEWPVASLEDNGYQAHCQKLLQESKRPNDGWRKFSLNIPKSKTEDHRERTSCKGDEAHAIKRKPEFKDQGLGRDGKRAKLAGSGLIDHPLPQENMQKKDETCGKLPCRRDLSVLLVEDDDSTRQIVGALLQNCGYKVTFAANGLQAWKLLEDPSSHIDLVLTEVTMPGMSGISLLTRLTHHEAYKRIPVIMMSPHDSIKVVFRCLSKGAADFLVKPVRKNELKNLWQHVWRRSQSSSGSGGESTSQIGTAKLQKDYFISGEAVNSENSDANSARHSDDGSTTQSLCIRKLDEQEHSSFHAAKENTIQIPIETCSDEIGYNDGHDEKKNISNGEQLATLFKNMENRDHIFQPTATRFLVPSLEHGRHCEGQTNSSLSNSTKAIDLIGTVASQENGSKLSDYHHAPAKQRFSSASSLLTLELSLKRPHDARDESRSITNHVVFQSGGSAFSRYHGGVDLHHSIDGMALQQAEPVVHTGQALPNTRAENFHQQSDEHTGSDSVMVDDFVKDDSPSLAESSMQNSKSTVAFSMPQPVMLTYYGSPTFGEGMHQVYFASQLTRESFDQKSTDHSPYFNHAHHRSHQHGDNYNYHFQYHHHQGEHISPNGNVLMSDASRGRSSSLTDFNKGQGSSVNGSATGSNTNGSNGYNGNVNMDFTNDGTSARLGVDGNHGVVDVEQGRSARREAALNKFRQKRKDRCFEKKVRYQSRKKLAEQRPRVRGQFVSQAIYDSSKADVAVM